MAARSTPAQGGNQHLTTSSLDRHTEERPFFEKAFLAAVFSMLAVSIVSIAGIFADSQGFRDFSSVSVPILPSEAARQSSGWLMDWLGSSETLFYFPNYVGLIVVPVLLVFWLRSSRLQSRNQTLATMLILGGFTAYHAYTLLYGYFLYPNVSP
jgi:hypothetical protein